MNGLRSVIKEDLDIINEANEATRDFVMKVDALFFYQLGTAQLTEDPLQSCFGSPSGFR